MGLKPTAESSKEGVKYIGNTLEAIQRGFEAADWVEVDVQCSASGKNGEQGKLFLFHDKELSPRTNAVEFSEFNEKGKASKYTREELQKLTLNVSTGDNKIISLDDAFDKTHQPSRKWIFDVTQKGIGDNPNNVSDATADSKQESQQELLTWINRKVDEGQLQAQDAIIFGEHEILKDYSTSEFVLGYTALFSTKSNILRALFWPQSIVDRAKELGCKYLVLPIGFADKELIELALSEELEVWVYGTESREEKEFLLDCGVTGFILDNPEDSQWLREKPSIDQPSR